MEPKVFIGSSVEGINIAYSIQKNLQHFANVTVWDQGVFLLSTTALDSLLKILRNYDFGIFVFSPDDITKIRNNEFQTVRDNVIFELGLFTGRLGKERGFIVMPDNVEGFHLPTDLLGIIPAIYKKNRLKENVDAALGPACYEIRAQIQKLGKFTPLDNFILDEYDLPKSPSLISSNKIEGLWLSRFEYKAYRNNSYYSSVQYDIEYLKSANNYTLYGENISCVAISGHQYWHQLKVSIYKNFLVGAWLNTNSENIGCFQLNINSSHAVMLGQHLGNANNNLIQPGDWKWIKIDTPDVVSIEMIEDIRQNFVWKRPNIIDKHLSKWLLEVVPIKLVEIQKK